MAGVDREAGLLRSGHGTPTASAWREAWRASGGLSRTGDVGVVLLVAGWGRRVLSAGSAAVDDGPAWGRGRWLVSAAVLAVCGTGGVDGDCSSLVKVSERGVSVSVA